MKTAFLHSDLEEIYMEQPKGYTTKGNEKMVCKLKMSLGLSKHKGSGI